MVKFLFYDFDTSKKKLTLARTSSRNIYLNLFGLAHFLWRSIKPCNIAKKTCLNYVWTVIFPRSFCSLKLQILPLFRARSSKTIECRFTLKHRKQPPDVLCKKRSFHKIHRKTPLPETLAQAFSCEFCEISSNVFFTEHLLMTAFDAYMR